MNWLDFLLLALIAWFTLTAYRHGFIRETVGLAAAVGGVILAGLYHDNLAESLTVFVARSGWVDVAAFLAILVITTIVGWLLALFLRTAAELLFLGWADRTAGALFGFLKAVLVIQAVIVVFVLRPDVGVTATIHESTIGSFFLDSTPLVRTLLPAEFDRAIHDFTT